MPKWMMDEEYSSGSIISKLTLTKFDKIKFQKSWHQAMMLKQRVGGDIQLILEEIGFQYFSHTQRMLDKKLCLIEI